MDIIEIFFEYVVKLILKHFPGKIVKSYTHTRIKPHYSTPKRPEEHKMRSPVFILRMISIVIHVNENQRYNHPRRRESLRVGNHVLPLETISPMVKQKSVVQQHNTEHHRKEGRRLRVSSNRIERHHKRGNRCHE